MITTPPGLYVLLNYFHFFDFVDQFALPLVDISIGIDNLAKKDLRKWVVLQCEFSTLLLKIG